MFGYDEIWRYPFLNVEMILYNIDAWYLEVGFRV